MAASGAPATPAAFYKMISIPEAQRTVLDQARVLDSETLGLDAVLGRVLSADVVAPEALPPFPASIKVPRHQKRFRLCSTRPCFVTLLLHICGLGAVSTVA